METFQFAEKKDFNKLIIPLQKKDSLKNSNEDVTRFELSILLYVFKFLFLFPNIGTSS